MQVSPLAYARAAGYQPNKEFEMAKKQGPKKSEEKKSELTDKDLEQVGGGMRPTGVDGGQTSTTHVSDRTATADEDSTPD